MSFIFLSYSKSRRDLTEALAAHLGSMGYEVWWDTSLVSADSYAHVIRDKLNKAAAVIVIWTETAVDSEWVYSEAQRGRDQKKLVQVLGDGVRPGDLPPPFDALHLDALGNREAILKALGNLQVPRAVPVPQPEPQPPVAVRAKTPELPDAGNIPVSSAKSGSAVDADPRDVIAALLPLIQRPDPYVIGIIGLPGAGKSLVADILRSKGITVIDQQLRQISELLDKRTVAQEKVLDGFGRDLVGPGGTFSHAAFAARFMGASGDRGDLEWFLFNHVVDRDRIAVAELGRQPVVAVLMRMTGLPYYSKYELRKYCHECWHIVADDEVMIRRRKEPVRSDSLPFDYSPCLLPRNTDGAARKDLFSKLADRTINSSNAQLLNSQVENALREVCIRASAAPKQVTPRSGPYVIGIMGFPGAGKSLVRDVLSRAGALVIDQQAQSMFDLVDKPGATQEQILRRFGRTLAGPGGTISHLGLASIMHHSPTSKGDFLSLLSKAVVEREMTAIQELNLDGKAVAAAVNRTCGLGLLYYDESWYIVADEDVMIRRREEFAGSEQSRHVYYPLHVMPRDMEDAEFTRKQLLEDAHRMIDTSRPDYIEAQVQDALREARIRASLPYEYI